MINFAANLNKMIDAGLGGPLDPPRTEVAVGHRVIYTEASGDVVNFETNVIAPVKNLRVTMEPIQAGSGDPSPENIRPITGRESVTVTRTGINVWDEVWELGSINNSTGENVNSSTEIRCKNYISIVPNTEYCLVNLASGKALRYYWYDAERSFIRSGFTGTAADYGVVTAPSNARYLKIRPTNSYGNTYNNDISINYPSTDHDYHAYDGQTATIQLGQTVYGGTLIVSSGICHSLWANIPSYAGEDLPGEWISDRDVYAPGTVPTIGAQVVYKREIADMIILTPAQLNTLVGENNVWSDAGSISLEYPYYEETEGY